MQGGRSPIDVWGNTAVATYRYEIAYEMGGQLYQEMGQDLFVFVRDGGRWRAVWRTLIPFTEKNRVAPV